MHGYVASAAHAMTPPDRRSQGIARPPDVTGCDGAWRRMSQVAQTGTAMSRAGVEPVAQAGSDVTRPEIEPAAQTGTDVTRPGVEPVASDNGSAGASAFDPTIHVVATTMSGSIRDQLKVGRIRPEFEARTTLPVLVHAADTHAEARDIARAVVGAGGRRLVSAGGAGTLNAVLEGALTDGVAPRDLRLAVLRKGSADLIGKSLGVPDELSAAVKCLASAIEADSLVSADVLRIMTTEPDGSTQVRHVIGFSGLGVFGEVPRFTESRIIKWYKGLLSQLLGDLGPFLTGMTLAAGYWLVQRRRGLVPAVGLTIDGRALEPERWAAVMVLNGDLGKDFPLGKGMALASGAFRVVALHYRGLGVARRQISAGRDGRLLERPDAYGAIVADAHELKATPSEPVAQMVNVDGLRLVTRGEVRWSVSGRVNLVTVRGVTGAGTRSIA